MNSSPAVNASVKAVLSHDYLMCRRECERLSLALSDFRAAVGELVDSSLDDGLVRRSLRVLLEDTA